MSTLDATQTISETLSTELSMCHIKTSNKMYLRHKFVDQENKKLDKVRP